MDNLYLEISSKLSKDDQNALIKELTNENDVLDVERGETLGIGEIILINLATALIARLLTKSPQAIAKFKKFIRKYLEIIKKKSKRLENEKIILKYRKMTLEFKNGSEEEFNEILNYLWKYHNKN